MIGLGVDLCEISRIERETQRGDGFLKRYYTEGEREYIAARGNTGAQSAAAIFAAKEAFLKAVGVGLSSIPLIDICVEHDAQGAPRYALCGAAHARMAELNASRAHLSITHEAGIACAVAVVE